MRMPLLRVERVVDDEVVPEPEKAAEVLEVTALNYPVHFVEGAAAPPDRLRRPDLRRGAQVQGESRRWSRR